MVTEAVSIWSTFLATRCMHGRRAAVLVLLSGKGLGSDELRIALPTDARSFTAHAVGHISSGTGCSNTEIVDAMRCSSSFSNMYCTDVSTCQQVVTYPYPG